MGEDEVKKTEEEKKIEEEKKKLDQEQVANPVDRAEAAVKAMEAANKKTEELLDRQEKARSDDILAGRATNGDTEPAKTEAEEKKAKAKEFFKGTQIEKAIEKHG